MAPNPGIVGTRKLCTCFAVAAPATERDWVM